MFPAKDVDAISRIKVGDLGGDWGWFDEGTKEITLARKLFKDNHGLLAETGVHETVHALDVWASRALGMEDYGIAGKVTMRVEKGYEEDELMDLFKVLAPGAPQSELGKPHERLAYALDKHYLGNKDEYAGKLQKEFRKEVENAHILR